jgi:hypothetical protein
MALFLKRDTKVYLEKARANGTVIWEIPVMDGYSFSQANTTSETVLNEMATPAGLSKRGRKQFNDALAPAEWSFSTYVRPFKAVGGGAGVGKADSVVNITHAIEEALWANFVGLGTPGETTTVYNYTLANLTADTTDLNISFAGSNRIELGTFNLYFVMGANYDNDKNFDNPGDDDVLVYRISGCVVNEATINFDVDGISMIEWSGMGSVLEKVASFDATNAITEDITSSDNFIRNKLTSLTVTAANTTAYPGAATNGVYNITLTGGSISFSNNINFLTPEVLGVVNRPIGHITGNKNVSGNFTAYLEDPALGTSGHLLANALADVNTITNSFNLTFILGGTGNTPRMEVNLPTAHLEIPTIQSEDVISVDIAFHGLPSTITANDEAAITYVGAT